MALKRRGYCLVNRDAYMDDLAKASHLRALFRALSIDTVIDIGANRGQFIQFLRRDIEFEGQILAYEPNPDCQPALDSLKARDEHLSAHAVAIADHEGSVELRIAESDDLTSILPFAPALEEAFEGGKLSRILKVPCTTIQTILNEIGEDRRIFLKSDTQGYDLTLLSVRGGGGGGPEPHLAVAGGNATDRAISRLTNCAVYTGLLAQERIPNHRRLSHFHGRISMYRIRC